MSNLCQCVTPDRAPDGSCRKCGLPGRPRGQKPEVHRVPAGTVINIKPKPTSTEASKLLGD
jgi:hypothetical protein